MAIFSLCEVRQNGFYTNRTVRLNKSVVDTLLICAEMTKISKRGEDSHFAFLPYSVYKLKGSRGSVMKPYLLTISVDEIYRPACFIKVFEETPQRMFSSRYYCFDLLFCDRSFWNSLNDDAHIAPPPYASDNPEDVNGFVLSTEDQLNYSRFHTFPELGASFEHDGSSSDEVNSNSDNSDSADI